MMITARSATAWLDDESTFRSLAARVDRLVELQTALARAFPTLPLTVVSVDDAALTLRTPHAAWASRARQWAPTLLAAARAHDPRIARVRIVAQRSVDASAQPAHPPRAAIPAPALQEMERLSRTIDTPGLEQALTRLVRQHRGAR